MKRAQLDREISGLESTIEETRTRYGARSKEYVAALERLKALRIERMKRDTNFRKSHKHKRAA